MKKSGNFIIVLIVLIIAIFVVIGAAFFVMGKGRILGPLNLAEQLEVRGVSFQALDYFTVGEIQEKELLDLQVMNIVGRRDDIVLRLELTQNMGEELASLYIEEKKVGIESLFVTRPAHYPGIITREVDCPPEFHPIRGRVGDLEYYIMYANERFSHGVCSPDLVKYRSVVGLGYCKREDTFVEIKLFYPPEVFERESALELLGLFRCR